MVWDVMEGLVKRVTVEESEIVVRKNKVTLSQEKIRRKAIQIERMSSKFEEMMQQRVEESFSKASEGSQKNKNIRTEQGGDRDDSFPARKTQLSYRFEHWEKKYWILSLQWWFSFWLDKGGENIGKMQGKYDGRKRVSKFGAIHPTSSCFIFHRWVNMRQLGRQHKLLRFRD